MDRTRSIRSELHAGQGRSGNKCSCICHRRRVRARGWLGGIVALFSLSAPAACIVVLLTLAYQRWSGTPLGHSVVTATAASIVGIIVGAAWLLAKPRVAKREYLRTAVLVLGALILSFWMPPLQIMAIGALLGYCWPERQT